MSTPGLTRKRATDQSKVNESVGDPMHRKLTAMVAQASIAFWKRRGIDEREFTRIHQWKAR